MEASVYYVRVSSNCILIVNTVTGKFEVEIELVDYKSIEKELCKLVDEDV